ncbi:MAG: UDP-N-acetylmuramoyl-L-alanine--D-glutamate ligase [bacterium]|nr:UDP-N-acetylmuramoyl-L-alanine--D-glutamate ligase [bacterium]
MDASAHFRGKKVTLMRIGLLGRGVGDAAFLASCGADVLVVDSAPQEVMQPSVDALKEFKNIQFKFGAYDLNDFKNCDLVLKGAGTPLDSPEIAEAKAHNIPVRMSSDLFIEFSGIQAIGVTGTRGKSTTTHMIAAILEAAGKKVLLGGNVRGVSTLALLQEVTPEHIAVLELDSWQCQGLGEARHSPHISVFTTFYPDHLNYYHGDLYAYLADKANIFLYQKQEDTLVLGAQCADIMKRKYSSKVHSRVVVMGAADLPSGWALKIPGEHNRYNGALALAAARAYGIEDSVSRGVLESFAGVPGRLEYLGEVRRVKVYNDNNATTPEATLAALAALDTARTVVIMGGSDKALDMSALLERLKGVKSIVLLAGTGTDRIKIMLPKNTTIYSSLSDAVQAALVMTTSGDTLLFSPAFASFGLFKNEYDRGDQFTAFIKDMQ